MGNKELDALIESYFKSADSLSQTNDVLSFEMLTEIIEEVIEDFRPTKKAVKEGRLPPDQWKELYRKLLMVGVDSDMVEAIKLLADSGMNKDESVAADWLQTILKIYFR